MEIKNIISEIINPIEELEIKVNLNFPVRGAKDKEIKHKWENIRTSSGLGQEAYVYHRSSRREVKK